MTTTSTIRRWYGPACKPRPDVSLEPAYQALNAWMKQFGYRPRRGVTGAYNCRPITGGTGYSLHAYDPDGRFVFWTLVAINKAVACDVNWDHNPYGKKLITDMPRLMINAIKAARTMNGKQVWRWGGDFSGNKDAMHFEVCCSPADLATGIDPATLPGGRPQPPKPKPNPAPPPPEEDELMYYLVGAPMAQYAQDKRVLICNGPTVTLVPDQATLTWHQNLLALGGKNSAVNRPDLPTWRGLLRQGRLPEQP